MGDAHHRVGEEGAHHQTEDGEGAGVRAHRGEGGRLGVGHGAFLAQSFGPLASGCAHEMIFGPKTIRTVPVNFDEKLVITAGKTLLYSTGSLYLDRFNNYPDPPTRVSCPWLRFEHQRTTATLYLDR